MFKKNSTFIIAEAGINHNGDFATAKKLIIEAKKCGADAIKFQSFKADELIIEKAQKAKHVKGEKSFFDMLKSWELTANDYVKLAAIAKKEGIIFFASVFGRQSLALMKKVGAPLFKIASCDLNNHFLLKEVAKTKKPVIISTGMGSAEEIKQAIKILAKGTRELGILHCISLYPPQAEELNLQRISILKKMFPKHVIGYSDHTLDIFTSSATILLGAKIIEKHFTLDKHMPGPDQPSSADPKEFKKMVEQIRFLEKAIQEKEIKINPGAREKEMKKAFRRSLVANEFIAKGTVISEKMLAVKRPGTGIPSSEMGKLLGKKAKNNLEKNTIISYSDITR
ncbi:MAG: N-acetylneuraminate synthase family protein [Patescibacteria group bacterium]